MFTFINLSTKTHFIVLEFCNLGGVPEFLLLIGILIFLWVRCPCEVLEPYDNPFWILEEEWRKNIKFPLALMVVLAPGSAHAWPSTHPPTDTSDFFLAEVSAESPSNIYPNPHRSHIRSFGTLGQRLKIPPFSNHSAGGRGGGLQIVFFVEILLCLWVRSPCKI